MIQPVEEIITEKINESIKNIEKDFKIEIEILEKNCKELLKKKDIVFEGMKEESEMNCTIINISNSNLNNEIKNPKKKILNKIKKEETEDSRKKDFAIMMENNKKIFLEKIENLQKLIEDNKKGIYNYKFL